MLLWLIAAVEEASATSFTTVYKCVSIKSTHVEFKVLDSYINAKIPPLEVSSHYN